MAGLCGCIPPCACELHVEPAGLLSLSGSGDPLSGGWTITATETPLSITEGDNAINVTPGGSYGHNPTLALNTTDTTTVDLNVGLTGLEANVIIDPAAGIEDTGSGVGVKIDPTGTAPVSLSASGLKVDCCPSVGGVVLSGNWADGQTDYALCADTSGAEIYEDSNGEIRANIIRGEIDSIVQQSAGIHLAPLAAATLYRTGTVTLNALPCQDKNYCIQLNHSMVFSSPGLMSFTPYIRMNLGADSAYGGVFVLPGMGNTGGTLSANIPIDQQTSPYNNVIPAGGSVMWDTAGAFDSVVVNAGNIINSYSNSITVHGISV